jgi:hypothetical protein
MAVNATTNAQRGAKKEGIEKLPFAHQTGYNCYETGRSIDGRSGPFRRHLRTWPHSVISGFLKCVGLGEESEETPLNTRFVLCQAGKLTANTAVGFGNFAGTLEDKCLSRVIRRQVSGTASRLQ